MCLGRGKEVYAIFSDEFMTKSVLESIRMNDTQICYDKKSFVCKWIILHQTIKLLFRTPFDEILAMLFKKVINDCDNNTKCVSTLVKLMEKKCYWVSYNIDNVEGTFGLCGSSRSESNHSNVKNLYLRIWKTFMVLCNN